jgi:hypothetical protein
MKMNEHQNTELRSIDNGRRRANHFPIEPPLRNLGINTHPPHNEIFIIFNKQANNDYICKFQVGLWCLTHAIFN